MGEEPSQKATKRFFLHVWLRIGHVYKKGD
jgi:hypothetical protein